MNLFYQKCVDLEDAAFSHVLRSLPRYTAPAWLRRRVIAICSDGHRMSRKEVDKAGNVGLSRVRHDHPY